MSLSHSRRYPGNFGEDDLKQALNLLFLIKGKQYQKKSPDFVLPTAEEFFFFAKFVSEEVFQKSSAKKLHRALSSDKLEDRAHYLEFFEFILHTKANHVLDRLCLCLDLVMYALAIYVYTGISMKFTMADTPDSSKLHSEHAIQAYKQLFLSPIQWFCAHTMPCLEKHTKDVLQLCFTMYKAKLVPLLVDMEHIPKHTSLYKTAQSFSTLFQDAFVEPGVLDTFVKKPVLRMIQWIV